MFPNFFFVFYFFKVSFSQISAEDEAHISLLAQDKEKLQKAMDMMNDVLESNSTLDFAFGSIVQAEIVEVVNVVARKILKKERKIRNLRAFSKKLENPTVTRPTVPL